MISSALQSLCSPPRRMPVMGLCALSGELTPKRSVLAFSLPVASSVCIVACSLPAAHTFPATHTRTRTDAHTDDAQCTIARHEDVCVHLDDTQSIFLRIVSKYFWDLA